jgi:dihydroflavonol-4-reductase
VTTSLEDLPGQYCRSKFLAEQAALMAARRGLPVVIVNPTLPVGPGDWGLTPPTEMLLLFLNGQTPAFLDGPLNFVDVRDAALGHLLAAEKGRVGERYILGGKNLKISQLLDLLHELTGLSMPRVRVPYGAALVIAAVSEFLADRITHRPPRAPLAGVRLMRRSMAFDSSKAKAGLGLPETPLHISLADAIEWFREQGYLHREIRGSSPRLLRSAGAAIPKNQT